MDIGEVHLDDEIDVAKLIIACDGSVRSHDLMTLAILELESHMLSNRKSKFVMGRL